MKNHIAFKFLAVLVCAVTLLGAVGSAGGILVLTQMDLYNKTVDQVVEEEVRSDGEAYANILALRCASRDLGNCPEDMVRNRYTAYWFNDSYNPDYYGYAVLDAEGNVLDSYNEGVKQNATVYAFQPSGQYMYLVSLTPESEKVPEEPYVLESAGGMLDGAYEIYDAIPDEGAAVSVVTFSTENSSESAVGDAIGFLFLNQDGQVVFRSFDPWDRNGEELLTVSYICFQDVNGEVLYEASLPEGIGTLSLTDNGCLLFTAPRISELTAVSEVILLNEAGEDFHQAGGDPSIGCLYYDRDGFLIFQSDYTLDGISSEPSTVAGITLRDGDGNTLCDALDPDGVGTVYANANGNLVFRSSAPWQNEAVPYEMFPEETVAQETQAETAPEEADDQADSEEWSEEDWDEEETWTEETVASSASAAPEENASDEIDGENGEEATQAPTAAPTEPPATTAPTVPETIPETLPEATAAGTEPVLINGKPLTEFSINRTDYYDSEAQETMYAEYVYTPMPEYTVEIYMAPGAMRNESEFTVLRIVRSFRNDLFLILGVSLLLFAIAAVYLCCAAGRKPKCDEIHAGGLNCLPLDLYLALTIGGIAGIAVLGVEGTEYLLRQSIQTGCVFAVAAGFCASLLFVGFCFAFVAQIKTPGGYWWRNTLCGHILRLCVRFAIWLEKFLSVRFFPALGRGIKKLWHLFVRGITWLGCLIRGIFRKIGNWIHRFFSLLPLTWQWLLVGCVMIFVLALSASFSSAVLVLFGIPFTLGIILYAAHAFGVLLESTKRMSKGDLDTKVNDKLLIGSFDEFAHDLNDLADVAVVAAQKQLKSERMKTELITNVSHDIKTPLTSIINYVDLLQKPHTEAEQEQYLEVLSRQSLRLKKLIDDLMEMSKASTGNMTVDITKLDAVESVNQALGEFADKLDKVQLLPVFRHTEESIPMMADGRLVWRVMSNLLSNAVKYAMPGTRLYIDLMRLEGKVVISIKNISRDELNIDADELMERFVRGDDSRNTEGSGLGLNIAKSLMELQKGQLQLLVDGDLFKVTLIFPGA